MARIEFGHLVIVKNERGEVLQTSTCAPNQRLPLLKQPAHTASDHGTLLDPQAMPSVEDPDITTDAYADRWLVGVSSPVSSIRCLNR